MANMFNNKYNTRKSGRYNTPGQFVPASEPLPPPPPPPAEMMTPRVQRNNNQQYNQGPPQYGQGNQQFGQNNQQFGQNSQQYEQLYDSKQPQEEQQPQPPQKNVHVMEQTMSEVKDESMESSETNAETQKPAWMKSRLSGVKKLSNKERRRRQNETLRRLLSPKNALVVLNEIVPAENLNCQFNVELATNTSNYKPVPSTFCADLAIEGNLYKGYGGNKIAARNAAAEQAIRDLIIKRLSKMEVGEGGSGGGMSEGDEESLPMIQLASFALHKLFSEWECEGHKVPQLKPQPNMLQPLPDGAESMMEGEDGTSQPRSRPPKKPKEKKPKELPANASSMHPCMLLVYMRPGLTYRELEAKGQPPAMIFTVGVDVDNNTYIGQASSKKEARKAAARAACQQLFNVVFDAPPAAQPAGPPPAAAMPLAVGN